jgi:hypothetical protein
MDITQVILCIALVAAGLVSHFVWRLSQLEDAGQKVDARAYLIQHKWATLNMVFAAYGLLILAYFTGELGPVGSFTFGVAADAAAERMRMKARAKVEEA